MMVSRISSPAPMRGRPKDEATRLIASVALRVKTISSSERALRKPLTFSRAFSKLAVARLRQMMEPAMDVGVFVAVGVADGIDHALRLLRRGAVVEIGQRLAVDRLGQNGKVGADRVEVERRIDGADVLGRWVRE